MTRPIWQRAFYGDVPWKNMTTKMKVANVVGGIFALMMFMSFGLLFVVGVAVAYGFRYRKLLKAEQS